MSRGRKPEGPQAMSGAERQARYRARQASRRGSSSRARVSSPDHPRVEERAGRASAQPSPALARGRNRAPHPAGRIRRLARRLAGSHSWQRHRRGSPGHRRPRSRRDRRRRSTPRLRTRLAPRACSPRQIPDHRIAAIRLQPQVSQLSAQVGQFFVSPPAQFRMSLDIFLRGPPGAVFQGVGGDIIA